MPSPTRLQVKTRFRILLDDPNGATFNDSIFSEGFTEAYDTLFNSLLNAQAPRIELVVSGIQLNPNTVSFNPASNNILDLASYIRIEERLYGSVEKFTEMYPWDQLPQRDATDRLVDYVWRFDTFFFVGATTTRELQITYESSGTAPTSDGTTITVDGCLTFLAKAAAAAVAQTKGYDELGEKYHNEAYGSRYDETGVPGGELLRIIAPRVREEQHTPMAIKPYSVYRSRLRRRVPYVVAQQPQGIGMGPAQFSSAAGTVTGAIDGVNANFFLTYAVTTVNVYRNGLLKTSGVDYTFGANLITFIAGHLPQPGDTLVVEGWI